MTEIVVPSAPTDKREYSQEERQSVVIAFSGDSGDGMQLTGGNLPILRL